MPTDGGRHGHEARFRPRRTKKKGCGFRLGLNCARGTDFFHASSLPSPGLGHALLTGGVTYPSPPREHEMFGLRPLATDGLRKAPPPASPQLYREFGAAIAQSGLRLPLRLQS